MIENPIFIIGTERSGSNLLRLILNAHPNIAIAHPPHIMRDLFDVSKKYGDLNRDQNFKQLIEDVIYFVKLHFAEWPVAPSEEYILKHAPGRSLYGIYVAIYEEYLQSKQKKRWGCKSTFMHWHIDEILHHHQSPRLIHLVRDPRDVAASAKKSIFSHFHPYKVAMLWEKEQRNIIQHDELINQGKMLRVFYENLVANPEIEIKKIMIFLGEEFSTNQLNFFEQKEAKDLAQLSSSWENCKAPVSTKSVQSFKDKLSTSEIELIESVSGELMRTYGYELITNSENKSIKFFRKIIIEIYEKTKKIEVEFLSVFTDKIFYRRWRKNFFIYYLRCTR